jgi:excisionase family DNA binding protein
MQLPESFTEAQVLYLLSRVQLKDVFNTEEAAAYLRVSRPLLEGMRVAGDGPRYSKIGRLVRYRRAALDEWLSENERNHTSENT